MASRWLVVFIALLGLVPILCGVSEAGGGGESEAQITQGSEGYTCLLRS